MGLLPVVARNMLASTRVRGRWFVGIDLGTTNSTVALVDAEAVRSGEMAAAVRVLPVRQETERGAIYSPLLPSCVAEVRPGIWWVGQGAREARKRGLVRGRNIFYSTKLEMGLGREPFYPRALSPDLDCPYKVAAAVLRVLCQTVVEAVGPDALQNTVISVPASFQAAARRDTLRAAERAGITLTEYGLIDEPNAALLDYLLTVSLTAPATDRLDLRVPRFVLVFDFGGGTCDVSILRVQAAPEEGRLELANLAISRYEQLGGDNIDSVIVERLLLPELFAENGIDPLDVSWAHKKNVILPMLLDVAEALKIGLCDEYARQLALARRREDVDRRAIVARQPSVPVIVPLVQESGDWAQRQCILRHPQLSLDQFERLLEPFLDRDILHERSITFTTVASIFAPVQDALQKANLQPEDIDIVLMVGGSSLIPQVRYALEDFFRESRVLMFPNRQQAQLAIARGAALHSFFLHGFERPLIKPIAQEALGLLVQDPPAQAQKFFTLIPAGTELPYPSDNRLECYSELSVPRPGVREVEVVIVADNPSKIVHVSRLHLPSPARGEEPIALFWRLDANKVLTVQMQLVNDPAAHCTVTLENPLCATGFQGKTHRRVVELEQKVSEIIASKEKPSVDLLAELARLYLELRHYERALEWARSALLRSSGGQKVRLLNLMGLTFSYLNAPHRAERCYRDAIELSPRDPALYFNLSLALEDQERLTEALTAVEQALTLKEYEAGMYLAQRAALLKKIGRSEEARREFERAARQLDEEDLANPVLRSWRIFVAQQLNDRATVQRLHRLTDESRDPPPYDPANLPAQRRGILPMQ